MKSIILASPVPKKTRIYPCLGHYESSEPSTKSIIILFISPKEGTVIHSNNNLYSIGYYSETWATDWVEYSPTVQLFND